MDELRNRIGNNFNSDSDPQPFREHVSSRSNSASPDSSSDGPHQVPRPESNNDGDAYKRIIFQVYSAGAQLVNAFQVLNGMNDVLMELLAISWWKKSLITLTLFTIGSYYGLWSFQFSPTAYLSWKETATMMTGIQGTSLILAFTYAILRSENVKNFLQAWTEGTPLKTAVVDNLGPEFQGLIFKAPKYLVRMLPFPFQFLYSFGNYILAMLTFCKGDVLLRWLWIGVQKCVHYAAILYSVFMGIYTGGLLVLGNPMLALASVVFIVVSPKYSSDIKQFRGEAINIARSILYYCCNALIWYKLGTFVISPLLSIFF